MANVLRIVLGVLMVTSLVTIVAYAVIFFFVAAQTAFERRGSPRDPLADELDGFLAELWVVDNGRVPPGTRAARGSW